MALSPKSIILAGPNPSADEQVSDRFVGACDKLATFQVEKPVADRRALSRHVVKVLAGSLCFRRASQMDFKKRPDVRTCSTLL